MRKRQPHARSRLIISKNEIPVTIETANPNLETEHGDRGFRRFVIAVSTFIRRSIFRSS